ncbi:MAG: PSP1 domain-containing protein [Patescibacteria group bacterium]|jgi:cell fate regulator YaaT (PSP1 superfamily)|nr:regulatory iron-sulfur-containing complex subunit RicT [bacterium]HQC49513.1 regulatory iron-sulfur-containing complex subunit RicT [bacterium]
MKIVQVQFAPWDKAYNFYDNGLDLVLGDYVIVETEIGQELGKVVVCDKDEDSEETATKEIKKVIRRADFADIEQSNKEDRRAEALSFCRSAIEKYGLPMKLVDVHFSFEGNRINFAFIADGRVDFRDLVKELAAHFNANIRLTQIGTRDEAKISGDCGLCGRALCCKEFLCEFSSITSEMAEVQQVVHRGSERISGMCGRLMCCLAFEYEGYKHLAGKLPPIGTKVNVDGVRGVVSAHHILKQTVDVKIAPDKADEREITIEVDPNRRNKKLRK